MKNFLKGVLVLWTILTTIWTIFSTKFTIDCIGAFIEGLAEMRREEESRRRYVPRRTSYLKDD